MLEKAPLNCKPDWRKNSSTGRTRVHREGERMVGVQGLDDLEHEEVEMRKKYQETLNIW